MGKSVRDALTASAAKFRIWSALITVVDEICTVYMVYGCNLAEGRCGRSTRGDYLRVAHVIMPGIQREII